MSWEETMSAHPSPDTLTGFLDGRLSRSENAQVVSHLLAGCSSCRRQTEAHWRRMEEGLRAARAKIGEEEEGLAAASSGLDAPLARALETVRQAQARLMRERSEAPKLAERIAAHPHSRQVTLVRNSRRFQTWGLCELLLKRSYGLRYDNPRMGAELAELALLVAEVLSPATYEASLIEDLKGRAWSYLANSRRILADFRGAREAIAEATACLERGTGDPFERAGLLIVSAALDRCRGEFLEAIQKLDRAIAIYRKYNDHGQVAQAVLDKGYAYMRAEKPRVAMRYFREVLELADPSENPQLVLCAEHNLTMCLNELGRHEEAWTRLPRLKELHQRSSDQLSQLRLRWVEAQILLGLDRADEAEAAFREVREGFAEEGLAYDVALVSLDLATIHLRRGETADLRQLATEVLDIARSRSVDRDAMAALILFANAAKVEQVTIGLIQEIVAAISRARVEGEPDLSPERSP